MQPGRIGITVLITLLAATATAFAPHFPLSFAAPPALAQTSVNRKAQADRLLEQGNKQLDTSQFQAALQSYQQALAIYKEIGDRKGEANSLRNLGNVYYSWGQYQKTIEFYQQSLAIAPEIGNRQWEADSLNNLGETYRNLGQYQKAIEFYQQSLIIAREIGYHQGEANSRNNLGIAYDSLGQYQKAIEFFEQSLAIAWEIADKEGEARSLGNLGSVYNILGQYQKAIEFHQQSLAIAREIADKKGEATSLNSLGNAYNSLGQYQRAIEFYQQSLAIESEIGYRSGEVASLGNLGNVYLSLGQSQKALEFYQQSLAIAREIGDHFREGTALLYLGNAYLSLGQDRKALEFYQQSLAIARETDNYYEEAASLGNLGIVYYNLSQYQKAIEFHQQALMIAREIGTRQQEAKVLNNLGDAYKNLEQYQKANEFYQQSLAIVREISDREGEGFVLSHIGILLAKQNQPELAIIFYKQSVNVREAIRQDIRGLSKEQQQSYTETIAGTYRRLADLLLKQDRILEAQRVLDLLKVQELEDYLNNVRGSDNSAQGIANRAPEQQFKQAYDAILNRAIEQGKELAQLGNIPVSHRTETQKQRVLELRKNQQQLVQQFQAFLKSPEVAKLIAQLRKTTGGEGFDLDKYATSLQDNLKQLQQDAVILYPFVLDERLELVLVTPYAPPIRRTVAVKREELNRTIVDFRTALKKPYSDAKTPAKKLYNWLIKPIENDLTQAKAKTIIYAPDGQLRYIPISALYDGNQWLVQRFGINNITALSLTDFNTKPQTKLQVLAGAFTSGSYNFKVGNKTFSFSGLKYAGIEVDNLAKTVPGTTKVVDKQFNQNTILQMNDYSVVHLATHAAFVAGQPEQSFILFGDGSRATLRDVGSWRLPNVELMVLSACETGLGDKLGDGKEVLGFGYQMQQTGARAAIASLWQVNDGGTQALMDAFYAALEKGNITKAEALRQAQIALITGDYKALGQQRGLAVQQRISSSLPPTVNSRLSHPYYWAPFILIGNGL
ncbi:MAG TPA: tetratricopeptide repeat protein [Waterburya sp.]|jgi:CHAT domain-containing protein/Flp pilus assembly protein TadD